MQIDRRAFFASLGGAAAVSLMDPEAKAGALENYMSEQLCGGCPAAGGPQVSHRGRAGGADREPGLP